jgi:hypothetical protein
MTGASARNAGTISHARFAFCATLATAFDVEDERICPSRSYLGALASAPQDRMVYAI